MTCDVLTVKRSCCSPPESKWTFIWVWILFFSFFSLHCEQCLKRKATERAEIFLSKYVASGRCINYHKNHIHTLLNLRQRNIQTFVRMPYGMFPVATRILINRGLKGERLFTTGILRAMMRVTRVRYLLLGTAGAGGIAAKVVSYWFLAMNFDLLHYSVIELFLFWIVPSKPKGLECLLPKSIRGSLST